ncbi:MAG: DRTGG domain-containing protein [Acutalibacteraceae bacterium]
MTLKEIVKILGAEVICRDDLLTNTALTACGSDMMSDVLAFVKEQAVLLTGLVNPQVIRTAEMMDMHCIIFVRGKRPNLNMIEMAEDRDMVILCTDLEMFTACGKLYEGGLRGGSGK